MIVEPIGWKHLFSAVLIVATIAIVVIRREQYHYRMIVAIALFTLGTTIMLISTIFQFNFGFVDLELAALIVWMAATGYALSLLGRDDSVKTDS